MRPTRFALLVPIKDSIDAKTRLDPDPARRLRLRQAFAADALRAARASERVVPFVVGDGAGVPGVQVLPDEGDGDLNLALVRAARRVPTGLAVAVMLADLPCLLTADLEEALSAVAEAPAFVADADGTGTTLLACPGADLRPAFGPGSARLHEDLGAVPVHGTLATLRRDVDTPGDLAVAVDLGVGPATLGVLAELDLADTQDGGDPSGHRRPG